MTDLRQRRVGAYAKLLANYASDDAVIAAGEKAELLFVRSLAFLATSDSDGYITDAQVTRFVGAGMRDTTARARQLVDVGLWERADGGYIVRSWTKIHETAEEKGRKRKTDRERKRVQPDSVPIPNGIRPEGVSESLLGSYVSSNQPTEQSNDRASQGSAGQGSDTDASAGPPSMFCSKHPNGTEAPCGPCGTAKARYKRHLEDTVEREAAAKAKRAQDNADCPDCDENGIQLDDQGKPVGRCDHPKLRRAS